MKVSTILDQIDLGSLALPEFQRGYVWNREQVKGLLYSLYRRYPVGSLLVWVTQTEGTTTRGDGPVSPGYVKLLSVSWRGRPCRGSSCQECMNARRTG